MYLGAVTSDPIPTSRHPIGFWLKLVDRLIDEGLDATVAGAGLTRRHWQVLNVLHERPASIDEIDARVSPFLNDDEPSTAPVLDELANDGWAARHGARFELTTTGARRYDELLGEVSRYRRSTIAGISDRDYTTAIDVLERMATNLGWSS
jgi:DNA-binding MarR family transcriptional regulator